MFERLLCRSLRFKILFGLLLSLLPMLAIVGITYYSALSTAENSKRIMNILSQNGAKEIDAFIEAQKKVFLNWTAEDVYGMAVEFQTTEELKDQFTSFLKKHRGFSLLMLLDLEGKPLVTAAGEGLTEGAGEAFDDRILREAAGLPNEPLRAAALVDTNLVKGSNPRSGRTFMFTFKTKNSEGNINGTFVAFVDWTGLQQRVDTVFNQMKENGFDQVSVAVLNRSSGRTLGHSDVERIGTSLEMPDSLQTWLQGTESGKVRDFDVGKNTEYITFSPIFGPDGLFEEKSPDRKDSDLCFMTSVDESDIMSDVRRILWTSAGVAGVGSAVVLLIGLAIVRLISRPLNRIIGGLSENSYMVAFSSEKVSSASQSLADGSSEQAASLEETSSSLEEMSSMTEQNAGNAQQADRLMSEANGVVSQANESLAQLTVSMTEISKASEETSKIIKTIDEIAFQTNLLALNAAVEAARAGEAGAGFAVVADEVRNLAMRAADAARDTAGLLEGTVKKVKDGSDLVSRTNDAFSQVSQSTAKIGELVAEIAAASKEQAQGIDLVSKAMTEMDKITQRNVVGSEESASAAEEMNAQAERMNGIVAELQSLVSGNGQGAAEGSGLTPVTQARKPSPGNGSLRAPLKQDKNKKRIPREAKEVTPEQFVPMDDRASLDTRRSTRQA